MADITPISFIYDQASKKIDFVNDVMKIALFSGTYNCVWLSGQNRYEDLSHNEIPQMYGYITGGFEVQNKSLVIDVENNVVKYDMDDLEVSVVGGQFGPVRYGVLYNVSNLNKIVYIFDFLEDKIVNDGAKFKIKIDDGGLMTGTSTCVCA